ncbi:CGNR zinc finger domain-containing protein [Arthrobacter agilis]|uniref:CGNR zinc finger domain-containing protein n=1 Tax=Arthrobacter agilis TaxID=37921 RepID=UPI00277EFACF|nr:CGNR zinc finger domain-containing protein [Arthrobacter agilis]MDQ0736533.1 putative RNA-binding Zn ribbon-like protein [Arthrobacter agilis]
MPFTYDTGVALASAAALINTAKEDIDPLGTPEGLDRFLEEQRFSGSRTHSQAELEAVRALRAELEVIWSAAEDDAVALVNGILRRANALPQLVRHDEWDWHLHATAPEAPLEERMATEAAMALADVIRGHELDRLRSCAGEDCDGVVLDLSRNRSRRFCDTGNCANRTHVKAYRARKAQGA